MEKLYRIFLILVFVICIVDFRPIYAEVTFDEAQKMADEIHKKVATDIVYTDQEVKALYYQNIQIIELLKEIRNLLRQQLEKAD